MTATETPAETWQPATMPKVRRPEIRDTVTAELDRLAEESKRKKERSRTTCSVRLAAELLSYGGSSPRSIHRAMLILGVERRDVDPSALAEYLRRTEHLTLNGMDITYHRWRLCPCFRDPSLPPPPDRLQLIEADIDKHQDDIDRLRLDVDRLINFALATRAGTLPIAEPGIELEDVEAAG